MNIRNKLLLTLLPALCLIFILLAYFTYNTTHKALHKEIRARAMGMLDYYTLRLSDELEDMQDIAQGLKVSLENSGQLNEDNVKNLIKAFLATKPNAYGSAVAFQPGSFDETKTLIGPYFYRSGKTFVYVDLARPSYNYPGWDWYKMPITTGEPRWSEPYLDVGGGNVAMSTYSMPFFKNGRAWGVSTVDIALTKLTKIVDEIKPSETGYAFLLSKTGVFLSMRRAEADLKLTIYDAAKEYDNTELKDLGDRMTSGGTGFVSIMDPLSNKQSWFAYGQIPATGWSLAIVLPENELTQALTSLKLTVLAISIIGFIVLFIIVFSISTGISEPIMDLAEYAQRIAAGDFHARLRDWKSKDEVGVLTKAFTDMNHMVGEKIEELVEEKEMFKVAFAQMTDGLVIVGANWKAIEFNEAAAKLISLPTKMPLLEHLGALFESMPPLVTLQNISAETRTFLLSRKVKGFSVHERLQCTLTPILGEDGRTKQYILSIKDVSTIQ